MKHEGINDIIKQETKDVKRCLRVIFKRETAGRYSDKRSIFCRRNRLFLLVVK